MRAAVNSRLAPWLALAVGAVALQILPAGARGRPDWSRLESLGGQGVLPLVLGGWSRPAADLLWLRANLAWERRDPASTEASLRAVIALEPSSDYFRINAARMVAFDFPEWEFDEKAPAEVRRRRRAEFGVRALALLEGAPEPSAAVLIERARLAHQVMGDRGAAAALYQRAAERPEAPYFAGRLAVELLVQEGRIDEARDWLRGWIPRLPADEASAQRARMEARLEDLARQAAR